MAENARREKLPETRTHNDTASRNRTWNLKRIALLATGWIFVALGIAGLFLPLLQGILFLLIGLIILSAEYPWAGKLVARMRSRFPIVDKSLAKAHSIATYFFAGTTRSAASRRNSSK